jgi:hypothetical protein
VLIVIRPGVQINAIERDALSANGNRRDVRTHVVVEAVLIHAEVSRRVTQSNEARQELRLRILKRHRRPAKCGSDRWDAVSLDANRGQRTQECQPNESSEF